MYIVTNRNIEETTTGLDAIGPRLNSKGANELRLIEATKDDAGNWQLDIIPDKSTNEMKAEVGITTPGVAWGSQYVSRKVLERIRKEKRNLLLFVHGFNNDIKAILERSEKFSDNYDVEVVAFSWPANGGGAKGVVDYKSDKRDAAASVGALDRTLGKMYQYLAEFNEERIKEIIVSANSFKDFRGNEEEKSKFITRMTEQSCPFTVNLVLHSMGNYLFKKMLQSSIYRGSQLLFDNVIMVAADTNNEGHAEWVDKIQCRRRVYITINEDDAALMASRLKAGPSQKARLGHFPYALDSKRAAYVDVTNARNVESSHAYFEGKPIKNQSVKKFFKEALNGSRAEKDLDFDAATNVYRIS